jgi:hypothetical protein
MPTGRKPKPKTYKIKRDALKVVGRDQLGQLGHLREAFRKGLAAAKGRESLAKKTGGYTKREKASWGAWSPTRVVKPSKKTAAKAQRRSEQRGRFK